MPTIQLGFNDRRLTAFPPVVKAKLNQITCQGNCVGKRGGLCRKGCFDGVSSALYTTRDARMPIMVNYANIVLAIEQLADSMCMKVPPPGCQWCEVGFDPNDLTTKDGKTTMSEFDIPTVGLHDNNEGLTQLDRVFSHFHENSRWKHFASWDKKRPMDPMGFIVNVKTHYSPEQCCKRWLWSPLRHQRDERKYVKCVADLEAKRRCDSAICKHRNSKGRGKGKGERKGKRRGKGKGKRKLDLGESDQWGSFGEKIGSAFKKLRNKVTGGVTGLLIKVAKKFMGRMLDLVANWTEKEFGEQVPRGGFKQKILDVLGSVNKVSDILPVFRQHFGELVKMGAVQVGPIVTGAIFDYWHKTGQFCFPRHNFIKKL